MKYKQKIKRGYKKRRYESFLKKTQEAEERSAYIVKRNEYYENINFRYLVKDELKHIKIEVKAISINIMLISTMLLFLVCKSWF